MTEKTEKVLSEALSLTPIDRAELVERLLSSFEFTGEDSLEKLWAAEAEDRIDAYERGELSARPAKEVFAKLQSK